MSDKREFSAGQLLGEDIRRLGKMCIRDRKMGDRFNIKAAFMDGKVLGAQEIEEIAALPSKDALYAKVRCV